MAHGVLGKGALDEHDSVLLRADIQSGLDMEFGNSAPKYPE
jgi:hypothetical protein